MCLPFRFHYKNFSYAFFHWLLSKDGLSMWISAYPFVQYDVFLKVPYVLWVWDFVNTHPSHTRSRIWSPSINIYIEKWFLWPPKHCCSSQAHGKRTFFSTLNIMILQTVRNKCVRFVGHLGIQVSYKILQVEVPKKTPILHNPSWFQEGLFWGSFGLNTKFIG
jgi:hypothetical protein